MFFILSKTVGFLAAAVESSDSARLAGRRAAWRTRFARAGRRLAVVEPCCYWRWPASRRSAIMLDACRWRALPALGSGARRAGRHRGAGRRDRARAVARLRRAVAQRGRRAHDRDCQAGARLSECAHRLFRRRRQPVRQRAGGGEFPVAAARELRHAARARRCWKTRSRNTVENAVFTKALVQPKPGERWLLVTSAQHMPRAIGCFRRSDFRSRPIRSTGAPAAGRSCCVRSDSLSGGLARTGSRRARMGRPGGLLADRADQRIAAGAGRRTARARRGDRSPLKLLRIAAALSLRVSRAIRAPEFASACSRTIGIAMPSRGIEPHVARLAFRVAGRARRLSTSSGRARWGEHDRHRGRRQPGAC